MINVYDAQVHEGTEKADGHTRGVDWGKCTSCMSRSSQSIRGSWILRAHVLGNMLRSYETYYEPWLRVYHSNTRAKVYIRASKKARKQMVKKWKKGFSRLQTARFHPWTCVPVSHAQSRMLTLTNQSVGAVARR